MEGQMEGILLLVLKRHFVFKSREKNVKHLEIRALSAQSFKHNFFHWLHRTCCAPVTVSRGHLVLRQWAARYLLKGADGAAPLLCASSEGHQEDLVPGTRLGPPHLQDSYRGVKQQKP